MTVSENVGVESQVIQLSPCWMDLNAVCRGRGDNIDTLKNGGARGLYTISSMNTIQTSIRI